MNAEGHTRYFHSTTPKAADAILSEGFRDTEGNYMMPIRIRGVFLSDIPLDGNEGAHGEALLEVLLPNSEDVSDYELVEEGKPYREWCVPARMINQHAQIRSVDRLEIDDPWFSRAQTEEPLQ